VVNVAKAKKKISSESGTKKGSDKRSKVQMALDGILDLLLIVDSGQVLTDEKKQEIRERISKA
jgi:hypothetical protein